ncbi:MAG: alanine--tRNA ligase, partial [Nanoarchaeota archaeon]|nr:alanine--tRNA ligase [Nanoarchaeota archaeon]
MAGLELAGKTDKEIKKIFKLEASKNPDKYYPTSVLKKEGFKRKQCKKCGTFFWSTDSKREMCGDSSCAGGFDFFKNNPCKEKLTYLGVWKKFSQMFKKLGYTPIPRYPIVARWRTDMDFTIASIADFQPYVVSGEVDPPANPLVVPQFCLRFGDIDNVGITGSHMTCFNMIGQHMFVSPEKWDQALVFQHIHKWLKDGLGIPNDEIIFHEDAWAGGGNFGPCMEFFSRGLEIGNQVYMLYQQTEKGMAELKLKVLDMGMGMERCAWFSQGTPTIYDATFPKVMEKLRKKTGVKMNEKLMQKYVPYAGHLNFDEATDLAAAWKHVASKVGISVDNLKKEVMPSVALYSIAEHARGLLIAIADGALPSNVGGGYNLRIILRRALAFIDKYGWDVDLADVCEWHAKELKEGFPELLDNISTVKEIIEVEKKKFKATQEKTKQIVQTLIKKDVTEKDLIEQYDSNGISPDMIAEEAAKQGKKIIVPDNFYAKIAELHEKKEQKTATKREEELPIPKDLFPTKGLYFDDYKKTDFTGKVLWKKDNWIVLDQTIFYPVSGGQLFDEGSLKYDSRSVKVINVIKQGPYIVHEVVPCDIKKGDAVKGQVDFNRREQLTQHHTATHIVNAAARKVLGRHTFQAGAAKYLDKARLDITHFDSLSKEQLQKIEDEANKIILDNLPVYKSFMPRNLAEAKYGFALYQGGAVPG